jgi:hypothetical protein
MFVPVPIIGIVLVSTNVSWKTEGHTGGVGSSIRLLDKKLRRKYLITCIDKIVIIGHNHND